MKKIRAVIPLLALVAVVLPACVANPPINGAGSGCQYPPDARVVEMLWPSSQFASGSIWRDWTLSAANAWNNVQGTNPTGVNGQQPWLDGVNNRSHAEELYVTAHLTADASSTLVGWTPANVCRWYEERNFYYNNWNIENRTNWIRWTGMHELGHVFGLGHDPFNWNEETRTGTHANIRESCGYVSVMYWSIDALIQCPSVTGPTWEDTSGLAALYTAVT